MTLRDISERPELLPVLVSVYNEIADREKARADVVYDHNRAIKIQEKINKLKGR